MSTVKTIARGRISRAEERSSRKKEVEIVREHQEEAKELRS